MDAYMMQIRQRTMSIILYVKVIDLCTRYYLLLHCAKYTHYSCLTHFKRYILVMQCVTYILLCIFITFSDKNKTNIGTIK